MKECADYTMNNRGNWFESPAGIYVGERMASLFMNLARPLRGERILDMGCNMNSSMVLFKNPGCSVTSLATTRETVEKVTKDMRDVAQDIHVGDMEDLPFSDNEFDLVTMILSLEMTHAPENVLSEAVRVSHGRVFIALLNRISCAARSLKTPFFSTPPLHSFTMFDVIRIVGKAMPDVPVDWGSVVCFPVSWYPRLGTTDRRLPLRKNPLGAIGGLAFPVKYRYRTIQEPLRVNVNTGIGETRRVPGTVCNRKR